MTDQNCPNMPYRQLGQSGLKVSALSLGTLGVKHLALTLILKKPANSLHVLLIMVLIFLIQLNTTQLAKQNTW